MVLAMTRTKKADGEVVKVGLSHEEPMGARSPKNSKTFLLIHGKEIEGAGCAGLGKELVNVSTAHARWRILPMQWISYVS